MCLQFIAPFIHAHAFGFESIQAHAAHTYITEDMFHNHALSSDFDLHVAELNQQDTVETPLAIGSVFKVANGVKRHADLDIVATLLTCILVICVFATIIKYLIHPFNASLYPQRFYSPHAARAPPL